MAGSLLVRETRWSPAAAGAVALGMGQALLGLMALARPAVQTTPVLVVLATMMIVTTILLARIAMPVEAKAVLIASGCVALLGAFMVQDVFGLRSIEHRLDDATRTIPAPADDDPPPAAPLPMVAIKTGGGADGTALASAMRAHVADEVGINVAAPEIDSDVTVEDTPDGPAYRMTWSVRRGGERLWCGQVLATRLSRERAAVQFGDRIAAALMQRGDDLRCE